jgi:hypothetical protein
VLTVLPVSDPGISYGIWVLESLVKRYEENVVAIIQIGGEEDRESPSSTASFIVLLMDGFNFTAFVSDRGTMPETPDYSGTGSSYYDRFRKFALDFQGVVTGVPGFFSNNDREVNKYGVKAKAMGFAWNQFFHAAAEGGDDEALRKEFFTNGKGMHWRMNVYKVFLVNAVFTHLWELIS